MNTAALLTLIGDLYATIARLEAENKALRDGGNSSQGTAQ